MPKNIKKMTYGQLQDEHETNELAKNQLKAEAKKETNSKVLLGLSQQILALAQRNEELVKQQLVLMIATLTDLKTQESEPEPRQVTVSKKGKLKKPLICRSMSYRQKSNQIILAVRNLKNKENQLTLTNELKQTKN
ncbi:hypothetical protein QUA81_13540 [Microcoleus sp. F6_B4]